TIAGCMTVYDETLLRQAGDPATVHNLLAAGYSVAADKACHQAEISAAQAWMTTPSAFAFNPYQSISATGAVTVDEAYTESVMTTCRSVLGALCVLENNSLRSPSLGGAYPAMYSKMTSLGG